MKFQKSSKLRFLCLCIVILLFSACASKKDMKMHEHRNASQPESTKGKALPSNTLFLENIDIVNKDGHCRIIISSDIPPTYTVFKLSKPDRLIIDLPEILLQGNQKSLDYQNDYITRITGSQLQDKEKKFLRLEVSLKDDFNYNALSENNSLAIDIFSKPAAGLSNRNEPKTKKTTLTHQNKISSEKPADKDIFINIKNITISQTRSDCDLSIVADSEIGKYHSYSLQNPNRLAVDIMKAKSLIKKPLTLPDNPLIDKIRMDQKQDKVRIVIDLKGENYPYYQIAQEKNSLNIHIQSEKEIFTDIRKDNENTGNELNPENSAEKKYVGEKISMDFKDADIKNVLRLISDISGLNLIVSDNVKGNVTLRLEAIPWDEAFDIILETNNLGRIDTRNITRIETMDHIKKINHEKLLAKKSQENIEELVVKTFDISYAKAKDLTKFIKNMKILSDRGSATPFKLTNKLTIQDIAENVRKVGKLIKEQDVPTRQVLIEARIVQSNPSYVKELGVRWGATYDTTVSGDDLSVSGAAGKTNSVVDLLGPANGAIGFGYLTDKLKLDMQLSAMENEDKIKIISNPKILGLDNKEARIKQGVPLPYLRLNVQGVTSTEFKDAVLELTVTPKITPSNTIALHIYVTKNQKSAQTGAGNEPGIDIREVETDLLLGSGETVVIGGIYETTKSVNIKKVPFFGDLPYLGRFFRNEKQEDQITELLIFLTVTVVDNPGIIAKDFNDISG